MNNEFTYKGWLEVNKLTKTRIDLINEKLSKITPPSFSIVIPVHNPEPAALIKCLDSVYSQLPTGSKLDLSIVDDNSNEETVHTLNTYINHHTFGSSVVTVSRNTAQNHISISTNLGVEEAKGDYIVLLDHDDILAQEALAELSIHIVENDYPDIIYTDHDKIDISGKRFSPEFKPNYSPTLLYSYMYMGHLLCIKKYIWNELGGFKEGYEGSQDHDFVLRAKDSNKTFSHLAKVLYHWYAGKDSTAAFGLQNKTYAVAAAHKAIEDSLLRNKKTTFTISQPPWAENFNCSYFEPHIQSFESVNILLLLTNLQDIKITLKVLENIDYVNSKIVIGILDNNSEIKAYLKKSPHTIVDASKLSNFVQQIQFIINQAPQATYTMFIDQPILGLSTDYLDSAISYIELSGKSTAVCKLLDKEYKIINAGSTEYLQDCFPNIHASSYTYCHYGHTVREITAGTFTGMITKTSCIHSFNEKYKDVFFAQETMVTQGCVYLGNLGIVIIDRLKHKDISSEAFWSDRLKYLKFAKDKELYYNKNLYPTSPYFDINSYVEPYMEQTPKTLFFSYGLEYDGGCLHLYELIKSQTITSHDNCTVYSHKEGPLRKQYEELGVKIIVENSPLFNFVTIDKYEDAFKSFIQIFERDNYDLVFVNTIQMFYGVEVAKELNIPSIWNIHENQTLNKTFEHLDPRYGKNIVNCFGYPYKVIFVSESSYNNYAKFNTKNNMTVIYNGISAPTLFTPKKKKEKLHILCVGALCHRKNQKDLLLALQKVKNPQNIKVTFAGKDINNYKKELQEIKVESTIEFIEGYDISSYYKDADIMVSSSLEESFSRSILEGMQSGLLIIAPDITGINEQIFNNITGITYHSKNIVELASKINNVQTMTQEEYGKYQYNCWLYLQLFASKGNMYTEYKSIVQQAITFGESR